RLGGVLFLNKHRKSVRSSVILLLTNLLLVAGIIFTVEIVLIFLGIGNVFVPMTSATWDFLTKLVY
ncbi:MAG TPA: hypothetical protein VKF42_05485, partial [Chitinivibrionales bacterium]|nr:hypothetical protein [Chitinivibrionales bacterium]